LGILEGIEGKILAQALLVISMGFFLPSRYEDGV